MVTRFVRTALGVGLSIAVVSCGGGGSGSGSGPSSTGVVPSTQTPSNRSLVTVRLLIPQTTSSLQSTARRRPQFISPNTQTVTINECTTTATTTPCTTPNAAASGMINVSSCTAATQNGTTQDDCSLSIDAVDGSNEWTIGLYGAGSGTNLGPLLGTDSQSATTSAGQANVITFVVLGVPGSGSFSLGTEQLFLSIPGGTATSQPIGFVVTDASGAPITGPFANPVTATLTAFGTGTVCLTSSTAQGTCTSVTATQSSDQLGVNYKGDGTPGFYFTVALSAGSSATQFETLSIAPLFVTADPTQPAAIERGVGSALLNFMQTATNGTIDIHEASVGQTLTYAQPQVSSCSNGLSFTAATPGTGASTSFTLQVPPQTQSATTQAGSCTVTVTDALGTPESFSVDYTPTGGSLTIPGRVSELPAISPCSGSASSVQVTSMTAGPDGNVWFVAPKMRAIGHTTSTTPVLICNLPLGNGSSIAAGRDGNLYVTEGNGQMAYLPPSAASITQCTLPAPFANAATPIPTVIISGPDARLWFVDSANNVIGQIAFGCSVAYTAPLPLNPTMLASGTDGNVYFAGASAVGWVNVASQAVGVCQASTWAQTSPQLQGLALGPNASASSSVMWLTESAGNKLASFQAVTNASSSSNPCMNLIEGSLPTGSGAITNPDGIVTAPDGNLWVSGRL